MLSPSTLFYPPNFYPHIPHDATLPVSVDVFRPCRLAVTYLYYAYGTDSSVSTLSGVRTQEHKKWGDCKRPVNDLHEAAP